MALLFMLAIKMIANNFAACCCSHDVVASIAMSFKFITEHCVAISANSTTNHKQKVNNNTWLDIYGTQSTFNSYHDRSEWSPHGVHLFKTGIQSDAYQRWAGLGFFRS